MATSIDSSSPTSSSSFSSSSSSTCPSSDQFPVMSTSCPSSATLSKSPKWKSILLIIILQHLTGYEAIIYYTESVCLYGGILSIRCGFLTGLIQLVAFLLLGYFTTSWTRKFKLKLSAFFMFLAHLGYASAILSELPITWFTQCCIILFVVSFSLGWGPVPFLAILDMFPASGKLCAMGTTLSLHWIISFVVAAAFGPITLYIPVPIVFITLSLFCVLSITLLPWTPVSNMQSIPLTNT